MDRKDFALNMIRDVAARQKLPQATLDGLAGLFLSLEEGKPRIGAVLDRLVREASGSPRHLAGDDFIPLGPYLFFPAESLLQRAEGDTIRLTEKERDILLALLDARGEKVLRGALLDRVWGYAGGVETHTLETHIYRLRQKIEEDPARPLLLLTEEDGYSLSPHSRSGRG